MNSVPRLLPILAALCCAGCRQDMQIQPKYIPLKRSAFFPDGRASRPIPPGTIATDEIDYDPALDNGMVNGAFATTIPLPVTVELLERGHDRFDIYCSPCHGRTGDGYGMIAHRGFQIPADLNGERVRNAPPGYLYAVIANGYGAMAPYSYEIKSARDRWAVVAYIRALELSRRAPLSDVPPAQQSALEAQP
ncbi:MAG TPA: cytochrome c [Bryobacteraceae bacterium]|nr:cytochrome c [Bryobacteraceae bacterium]